MILGAKADSRFLCVDYSPLFFLMWSRPTHPSKPQLRRHHFLDISLTLLCCFWFPFLDCFCTLHILGKKGTLLTVSVIVGVHLFQWTMRPLKAGSRSVLPLSNPQYCLESNKHSKILLNP